MSGIFKNFEKIVPAHIFSTNAHKLRLTYRFFRASPAAYYFDPAVRTSGLPLSHSLEINQLITVAYNLVRQSNNYTALLPKAQSHQDVERELQNEITKNNYAVAQFSNAIRVQLASSSASSISIDSVASLIYSYAHSNRHQELRDALPLLEETLVQKIQYASTQNLIDIVAGLKEAQLFTESRLWRTVLSAIENKNFEWEYQTVNNHGWDTNVYEYAEYKRTEAYSKNLYELYLNQASKGNQALAKIKKNLYCAVQKALFVAVFPFFHREHRIKYQFDCIDKVQEKDSLFKNLEALDGKVDGAAKTLSSLRSRQQNY